MVSGLRQGVQGKVTQVVEFQDLEGRGTTSTTHAIYQPVQNGHNVCKKVLDDRLHVVGLTQAVSEVCSSVRKINSRRTRQPAHLQLQI